MGSPQMIDIGTLRCLHCTCYSTVTVGNNNNLECRKNCFERDQSTISFFLLYPSLNGSKRTPGAHGRYPRLQPPSSCPIHTSVPLSLPCKPGSSSPYIVNTQSCKAITCYTCQRVQEERVCVRNGGFEYSVWTGMVCMFLIHQIVFGDVSASYLMFLGQFFFAILETCIVTRAKDRFSTRRGFLFFDLVTDLAE